ncbi:hypothetical protein ADIS_1916 [Lunatimonas lonarensis]|uniref:Endonuclease GajA/Old nuclease/RecF-like AAA domain-containing protein n=1 Tax=Lunatimonas lonarensis TaxID=1232681 RepID=R7ZUE6_9BACT|nr:AAA family ATPase [Lunatimonas lonarensis]EON77697.1 hypothetical protein ADIS_1916 [Lunatimonas lonarensis]
MDSISFKNFRQFKEFPEMEFGGITFLVGKNNSGKSTIVKALLLMNDFISSDQYRKLSFGNNVLEDANIVTFGRALNNKCQEEDEIQFSVKQGEFLYTVSISAPSDKTDGRVVDLLIEDSELGINLHLYPDSNSVFLTGINKDWERDQESYRKIELQIAELEAKLESLNNRAENGELKKSSKEYLTMVDEFRSQIEKLREIHYFTQLENEPDLTPGKIDGRITWDDKRLKESDYRLDESLKGRSSLLSEMYSDLVEFFNQKHQNEFSWRTSGELLESATDEMMEMLEDAEKLNEIGKQENEWENLRAFYHNLHKHDDFRKKLINQKNRSQIIYLGANPSKQAALFSIRDKNNSLAQAIHQFKEMGLDNSPKESFAFFKKWFGKEGFNVGEKLEINPIAGEAYEVKVDGINLADRGMGSLQISLLLFRIAVIIEKSIQTGIKFKVVVEEPELNLHPRFQSILATLFFEVKQKYEIDFIVETHSEYLIRESQFIVKEFQLEGGVNNNPFKVYYLSDDQNRWEMKYRFDGKFINEFGPGFFDETRRIIKKML